MRADTTHRSRFGAHGQRIGERVLEAQRVRRDGEPLLIAEREPIADPLPEYDHLPRGPRSAGGADTAAANADVIEPESLRDFGRDRLATL